MTEDHPILVYETALVAARLTGDVAALDRLLDDELHFTGLGGQVFTKADDLAAPSLGASSHHENAPCGAPHHFPGSGHC